MYGGIMRFDFFVTLPSNLTNSKEQAFGIRRSISNLESWETLADLLPVIQSMLGEAGVHIFKCFIRDMYPKEGALLVLSLMSPPSDPYWYDPNYDFEEGFQRFLANYKEPVEMLYTPYDK